MNIIISSAAMLILSATLAACRKGDNLLHAGSTASDVIKVGNLIGATAAGLWTGMTSGSSALHYTIAILPDGQSWAVYSPTMTAVVGKTTRRPTLSLSL